jgi:glycerate dehydrogenase
MKAAFLDWDSLNGSELDPACLNNLPVEWQYHPNISPAELGSLISDLDIVVSNKVLLDQSLLTRATQLKLVCVAATGTNNVDLESARKRNIPVCNVRGYATESVVQHVFMLLLNLSRRFNQYQKAIKNGDWQRSEHFCFFKYPVESLTGKIMGIIGFGELGQAVATMAKQFGMDVIVAESMIAKKQILANYQRVNLETLLSSSDVVSLHCPLTEQTRDLIDKEEFSLMKSSAFLINTARGGIVNENALIAALKTNQIAGAATDVLTTEPPVNGNPLLESDLSSLIITPHIAWGTKQARQKLIEKVAENIDAWLKGRTINQVN